MFSRRRVAAERLLQAVVSRYLATSHCNEFCNGAAHPKREEPLDARSLWKVRELLPREHRQAGSEWPGPRDTEGSCASTPERWTLANDGRVRRDRKRQAR